MNYLEFDFDTENEQQSETLVALLNEQGFEGFEEEDNHLRAFIAEHKFSEEGFATVLDLFSSIIFTRTVVENINWNKKWEEDFQPVVIGDFVAVRAGFHQPVSGLQHEIIITPKMSFGTGHHATTHLMIQQMKQLTFSGKYVLDFGTGTGVLAILAEKLGAANVLAIDYDEWSITNTMENIANNYCEKITALLADEVGSGQQFDVILANINLNVLLTSMPAIAKACKAGGQVLLSGFLKENEDAMVHSLEGAGLKFLSTVQKGDWIAIWAATN